MFAISKTNRLAVVPLVDSNIKSLSISLYANNTTTILQLPKSFNEATTLAQSTRELFNDPAEDVEDNIPYQKALLEKKANENPFIRGLVWSHDGEYLGITFENYMFLLYKIDEQLVPTLISLVGLPRHLGYVTLTPNGKNWLIVDKVGDVHALSHSKLIDPTATITQAILFSVNTIASQFFPIVLDDTNDNNTNKEFLLIGDGECKIRISNLPHFFNIQSYLMGLPSVPTSCIQLSSSLTTLSPILLTATPGGYDKYSIADPESEFLPYIPTTTTLIAHNILNAELIIKPIRINHDNLFQSLIEPTQYCTTIYNGFGAININNTSSIIITTPQLITCKLSDKGYLLPQEPMSYRTRLDQLIGIKFDTITNTTTELNFQINHNLTINTTNEALKSIQILSVMTHPERESIYIHTVDNQILIAKYNNDNNSLDIINTISFTTNAINNEINQQLPTHEQMITRCTTIELCVAKCINFHWQFERAPTRSAAQKRSHLLQTVGNDDDNNDGGDDDDEKRDPLEVVDLEKESKEQQSNGD